MQAWFSWTTRWIRSFIHSSARNHDRGRNISFEKRLRIDKRYQNFQKRCCAPKYLEFLFLARSFASLSHFYRLFNWPNNLSFSSQWLTLICWIKKHFFLVFRNDNSFSIAKINSEIAKYKSDWKIQQNKRRSQVF